MDYDNLICSACPYSKGLQKMISLDGIIPCGLFQGTIYNLRPSYLCAMISFDKYTEESFYKKIEKEHGPKALKVFQEQKEKLSK